MKINNKCLLYILVILAVPAFAHGHIINGSGLGDGVSHPFSGIDHLLAMIAVGIISVQLGKKALWFVPFSFLAMMVFGGIAGILGIKMMGTEYTISLSVIALGIAIAFVKKMPQKYAIPISLFCAAVSGFLHGHAHGVEIPLAANPALYATGFLLSTTMLHAGGVLIGYWGTGTDSRSKLLRYLGLAVSLMGVFLLIGI